VKLLTDLAQALVLLAIVTMTWLLVGPAPYAVVALAVAVASLSLLGDGLRIALRVAPNVSPNIPYEIFMIFAWSFGLAAVWPAVPVVLLWGMMTHEFEP